ncbi:amidohydrolase [Pseudothermotoga elfii]|uniref:amidohydrolase n=1 Tax=Pseudothermotoga elfii TaxID=38322 RepID=UPI000423E85E|nr:amidohydrolase family protein [Pseudothermotoga elfii]
MIFRNCAVYRNGNFEKSDLFVENGIFTDSSSGPVIDLSGMYVMPGFVDSHAHILGVGQKCEHLNLEKICSQEELFQLLIKQDKKIILGRGWSEQTLGGYPDKKMLDKIQKPVVLTRKCGHVAVLNQSAMNLINMYKEDGIFKEDELEKIRGRLNNEDAERLFKIGEEEFLKHGVTFVHSDDLHGLSWDELKRILKKSRIRIFEKLHFSRIEDLERFNEFGVLTERVYVKGVKIFADGSLGGKTAYLSKPYADEKSYRGMCLANSQQIERFAEICSRKKVQLCIHAIGDAAVHEVAMALKNYPKNRLIHAQLIDEKDLKYLKDTYFCVQPHFAFEDQELISRRISKEFYGLKYDFLKLFKEGYRVTFSTDAPVSPHDPKYVIESALRMGFHLMDAINLYTYASSETTGLRNIGKIEIGYAADFAIYEKNPLKLEDDPIAVYVHGEQIWQKA